MTRVYQKLVRDRIPEIIRQQGEEPICRRLEKGEYLWELRRKLQEEMNEFLVENDPMELADLYEVMDALAELLGGKEKIKKLQQEKRAKNGSFDERVYLQEVRSKK